MSGAGEQAERGETQAPQNQAGRLGDRRRGDDEAERGIDIRREDAADAARHELLDRATSPIGHVEVAR